MKTMTMPQASDDSQDAQDTFSVTIAMNEDGSFTITPSDSDESSNPATADNIDTALEMVKQMFDAESGQESSEPDDGTDGDATMSPDDAKTAWKQMAAKKAAKQASM